MSAATRQSESCPFTRPVSRPHPIRHTAGVFLPPAKAPASHWRFCNAGASIAGFRFVSWIAGVRGEALVSACLTAPDQAESAHPPEAVMKGNLRSAVWGNYIFSDFPGFYVVANSSRDIRGTSVVRCSHYPSGRVGSGTWQLSDAYPSHRNGYRRRLCVWLARYCVAARFLR